VGRDGTNWDVHRGRGTPPSKSTEEFGKKLKKSFCFLWGVLVCRLSGHEKPHEIDEEIGPNDEVVRQKTGVIATRVKATIARSSVSNRDL
jgi:hypothetical protein